MMFPHTATEREQKRLGVVLAAYMATHGLRTFQGPCALFLLMVFRVPKSWSKAKRRAAIWHDQAPDRSNVLKLVEDSINKVGWLDDKANVLGLEAKVWSEHREGYGIRIVELPRDVAGAMVCLAELGEIAAATIREVRSEMLSRDWGEASNGVLGFMGRAGSWESR
jgi:Holliday junction resolvase RusA-like endonuclease